MIVSEILEEIKNRCDEETYQYLNSFITIKLNGYKLEKKETALTEYTMTKSQEWYKMFFISKKLQGLSNRSINYYKKELDKVLMQIGKPLDEVTSDDIRYHLAQYHLQGNVNKTSLDNRRRVLSTFFQWLQDEEYIAINPVRKIKKVKQKKTLKRAFTYEEIELLKMQCEKIPKEIDRKRGLALIEFLLSTGARAEEISNVLIQDINFETGEVSIVGKGDKERLVYLNTSAMLRLKDYLNIRKGDSPYVFISLLSPYNNLKVAGLEIFIRELGKSVGIEKVHPHRFRRTFATIAKKRGMPIEEIQQLLGHEDLGTTQMYVQVYEDDVRKSHEKYMN